MNTLLTEYLSRIELREPEQFKNVVIVPVFTSATAAPDYLTLTEALQQQLATITEVSADGSCTQIAGRRPLSHRSNISCPKSTGPGSHRRKPNTSRRPVSPGCAGWHCCRGSFGWVSSMSDRGGLVSGGFEHVEQERQGGLVASLFGLGEA